jgi:predicted alpha-1,2-mannosidase
MKQIHFLTVLLLAGWLQMRAQGPVDCVNILMGTDSEFKLSNGNTYPAIARPWGEHFWTPVTGGINNGWTYAYHADKLQAFKQTHQPSPWIGDYGQFSLFPLTGADKLKLTAAERASWFSHKAETAKPHYYRAYLADYDIVTEITPTERAAMFRFTFPDSDDAWVLIDVANTRSEISLSDDKRTVTGYSTRNNGSAPANFRNHFVIRFSEPCLDVYSADEAPLDNRNKTRLLAVKFKTRRSQQITAEVASSFISDKQAVQNLKELGGKSFDELKAEGATIWNRELSRIEVSGGTEKQRATFYSCLYRTMLFPRKFHEFDESGRAIHYSPYNGEVLPGYMFTDNGFWDTFRAVYSFFNLVYPSLNAQIQEGLANAYKESGWLPEWASPGHIGCMVGNNSASIVADAWLKGLRGYDIDALWEAVKHGANGVHPKISSVGRFGFDYYNKLGYVPYNVKINENVARTLEYAYDDWCIYQLGKALGKPEKEIAIYKQRALNYRNVFDKEHNLMRGRNEDGTFQSPFSPFKWGDAFTEGNSWHYTWSVFHDIQGLINLMGGKKSFLSMLDSVFIVPPVFDESYYRGVIHEIREMQIMNMGNYAHGNQPIQHMIYLYNYAGEPWKTQYWVREVMDRLYTPEADGYCGDEDNGQTSAWYVFSALGFYPVTPAADQYVIGSPLFDKAVIHLENGKTITITAANNSPEARYVKQIMINGADYTHNYFDYFELMKGADIQFTMDTQPNRQRGVSDSDVPYSMSNETAAAGSSGNAVESSLLPRSTPATQKFNSKAFSAYLDAVKKSGTNMHSIMVVRNGKVVAEHYFDGFPQSMPHLMHSVSKTFTATAIGFAVAEGKLKLTDKVAPFFPDKLPAAVNDNLKALEIRHLLTMSSGHGVEPKRGEGDWLQTFFNAPFVHPPGTQFVYNSLATYVLSAIIQKVTGEKLIDYLAPRLFCPLGIAGIVWDESRAGINCGGWGLHVKTEDMAKLGQFILQKGQWNGESLLPETWFDEATSSQIASLPAGTKREDLKTAPEDSDWLHGYGYQMWRSRHNSFRADGAYGQYILVLPEQNAVIATTAQVSDMQAELNLIWKYLLPAFR